MKKIIIALIAACTVMTSAYAAQPAPTDAEIEEAMEYVGAQAGISPQMFAYIAAAVKSQDQRIVIEHKHQRTFGDYLAYFRAAGIAARIAEKMAVCATMVYAAIQMHECGTDAQQLAAAVVVAVAGFYIGKLHSAWHGAKSTW
jgi:hypothetical protein